MGEVVIESTREGLFVKYGDKRVGPFKNINSINPIEVGAKLGIQPKHIVQAKIDAYKHLEVKKDLLPSEAEKPLREAIKFVFISPFYSKVSPIFNDLGELVESKTEFRLYKAYTEAKHFPYIIYDVDGYVNPKKNEYSLVRVDREIINDLIDSTPQKIWKPLLSEIGEVEGGEHPIIKIWEKGFLVSPVPRLRNVDFLRNMDWRAFIFNIVNFKGVEMDYRLKIVRLAHLMRGVRQNINPHALIILPGQTGKSEWYKYVGICEDKVSANGLIGYADADGPKPGSVDRSELPFALDQIESSGMYEIFRYMLGLMESGEARVDMASYPFTIYSQSVFAIISNPIGDPKSNFSILIEKLSRNPSLGRRFGIILYDKEAVKIMKREKEMEKLYELVSLFRAVEEYCLNEIKRIVYDNKVWEWLNKRNEEWVKQSLEIIKPLEEENENLYLFLKEFIETGWTHIRGGALRISLILNLDKIALKTYEIEDIINEAEEYLTEILDINFTSIKKIVEAYQETMEEGVLRFYDTIPIYMKEIVNAIEQWKRNLKEEEKMKITIPHTFYIDKLNYQPQTEKYFSKIIDMARKGNPEKYNDPLKTYFGFELKKEKEGLKAIIYNLSPLSFLTIGEEGRNQKLNTQTTLEKCLLCECFQEKYGLCLLTGLKTGPNDVCDKFIMRSGKHDQQVEDPKKIQGEAKVETNNQIEDQNHDRGEVREAERYDQAEVQGDTQILTEDFDEDLKRAVEYLSMYRSVGRLRFEMDLKDCGVKDPKVVLEKLVKFGYVQISPLEVINATEKLPRIKLSLSKFIN